MDRLEPGEMLGSRIPDCKQLPPYLTVMRTQFFLHPYWEEGSRLEGTNWVCCGFPAGFSQARNVPLPPRLGDMSSDAQCLCGLES